MLRGNCSHGIYALPMTEKFTDATESPIPIRQGERRRISVTIGLLHCCLALSLSLSLSDARHQSGLVCRAWSDWTLNLLDIQWLVRTPTARINHCTLGQVVVH